MSRYQLFKILQSQGFFFTTSINVSLFQPSSFGNFRTSLGLTQNTKRKENENGGKGGGGGGEANFVSEVFKGGKTWQRRRPEIWPCVVVGGGGEGAWGSGG